MVYEQRPEPVAYEQVPARSGTGYAAVKYGAAVIIVLAILAFLAWYVLPKI